MSNPTSKIPQLFSFPDTIDLAREVGSNLGQEVHEIEIHRFPDGESLVRAHCEVASHAWIFRSLDRPNDKIVEVLLAADALRRQGASKIGLIAPYLGYMRQDRIFRPGEGVSQQVVARMLDGSFDELFTVEAHLHRISKLSDVFRSDAMSVSAAEPVAEWLRTRPEIDLLVGPDAESEAWIRSIAKRAELPWRLGSKTRHGDRNVRIEFPPLPPGTRTAWIVDDIASSGATLEAIVGILRARGVQHVGAVIVHALFEDQTLARLQKSGLDHLASTNSISHATNGISLAPLLADAISSGMRRIG